MVRKTEARGQQEPGVDLPRTTTTGDESQDLRHAGDGAIDDASDSLHHAEDDRLFADSYGIVAAWKARLRGGRDRTARRSRG
jgi:hypothetical protein